MKTQAAPGSSQPDAIGRPPAAIDINDFELPVAFTAKQAATAGVSRALRARLVEDGTLDRFAKGLYRRTSAAAVDLDLLEVALRSPRAAICLASALARHGLTDEIPSAVDLAPPRGLWHPTAPSGARWHSFAPWRSSCDPADPRRCGWAGVYVT
jgi:hypothetical protein